MPYNTLVQRADVTARMPLAVSDAMLTTLSDTSAALRLGTRINMPAGTMRFPVLSALPTAYWVNGDTGLKQTSTAAWDEKFITVEELAVIVPVPENVLDDAGFDIWAAVRPLMETAISRKIDQAVFLETDKPASFPRGLAKGAEEIENKVQRGTNRAEAGGFAADISDLFAKLEEQGYFPDGGVAAPNLRGVIRKLGTLPITLRAGGNLELRDWYGANIEYPMRGLWSTEERRPEAIVGDFSQLVVGVRRDFEYKLMTEGVITDSENRIVFNLPQQDMLALRITFRMGYQVANPINFQQPDETRRYPFGVMLHA